MAKATAVAPANMALMKYWGRKDEELRLPENGSISINCSNLLTTTTVEFSSSFHDDEIVIDGEKKEKEAIRTIKHLDRIRAAAHISHRASVVSQNSFPSSTGLSSSSSGFAALTVAGAKAAGLNLSEKELSIFARQGSGSACRSIPSGIVEWLDGDTSETSYAVSLYEPEYWDIADIVAIVSRGKKEVSTSEGQEFAFTSPFFAVRKAHMRQKIDELKTYLAQKDFQKLGELVEAEALELHSIMLTSRPALIYLQPGSLQLMKQVMRWRSEGLGVYFNVNTGQDVHILCMQRDIDIVKAKLAELDFVRDVIVNVPAMGTRLVNEHLF